MAELPANTHKPQKHARANGAGPASSVISEPAGGSGASAPASSVVRTVVKSHRSKGADTFDQLCQRAARGVWEACNSSHMLTTPSDVAGLQEKMDGD